MSRQRGVLIIVADDWSPIARCYGDTVCATPAIDGLADQACVFDHAFCVSPSCAASRASLLTGRYPHTHGQYGHCHSIHGFSTRPEIPTLPQLTAMQGVRSALIGKSHIAPDEQYPFDQRDSEAMSARAMGRAVGRFIGAASGPFFVQYAPLYPHRSFPRGGSEVLSSAWLLDEHEREFDDAWTNPESVPVPPFLPDAEEVREDLAGYYTAIARFDRCVGAALDALDRSGRRDDTLIMVLSDHGMPFPGAKASSFDSGHRCPLIVSAPGLTTDCGGRLRSDAVMNWCDLLPTCCDWLGIDAPADLTGRSILPLLDGQTHVGWDETFFSHCFHEVVGYDPYRVLRGRRYKFVQNLAAELPTPLPSDLFRSPTWQYVRSTGQAMMGQRPTQRFLRQPAEALYDVAEDPLETVNLIDIPAMRETIDTMRSRLMRFREQTDDPWLEIDAQRGYVPSPGVRISL